MAAPPSTQIGPVAWARQNLFSGAANTATTIVIALALAYLIPLILQWAVFDAVLTLKPSSESWWGYEFAPNAEACRTAGGACWDFVAEKIRVFIFGLYPQEEQWRPILMMLMLFAMIAVSVNSRFHNRWLLVAWVVAVAVMYILMQGGIFGLPLVETDKWGGLPVTLIIAVTGIVCSFPLAILLALGRQSDLPIIKTICVAFIEIIRGVPLITVLFMASLMIPLFLPDGVNFNKLMRALVAFTLFSAAYVAEVIRGGLQALPKGQYEAADAMGMSYWQKTGLIVLPQALKMVIPPTMNTFIGLFKDTTLIIMISMFDFLGAIRLASNDPIWRAFYVEGLVFAAIIYFIMCYAMASYARHLEHKLDTGHRS
jgi:general L-amino acid transport system permease protein